MRKSKFTRAQIVQAIRQVEADTVVGKVCRKLGVTEATFYPWKKTYAVLDLHELRERRQLRDENLRLKQVVADLTLDRQDDSPGCARKYVVSPAQRRDAMRWAQAADQLSERRACRAARRRAVGAAEPVPPRSGVGPARAPPRVGDGAPCVRAQAAACANPPRRLGGGRRIGCTRRRGSGVGSCRRWCSEIRARSSRPSPWTTGPIGIACSWTSVGRESPWTKACARRSTGS